MELQVRKETKSKRKYSKQIFRNSFWLYRTISSGISSLRSQKGSITTICSMLNLLPEQSQTYALLSTASDAVFYFMPVILAYTSAKRFQCNEVLAIVIAGVLLHPNFVSMVTQTQEQARPVTDKL